MGKNKGKNASYRNPKGKSRPKKYRKILKICFSKTSVLNVSSALPNISRWLTHVRVATLSWKIRENRDLGYLWNMQYEEKQGKKTHPTENLRENFAQKKLQKFWKFFFENFSIKHFQRTSERFPRDLYNDISSIWRIFDDILRMLPLPHQNVRLSMYIRKLSMAQ